MVNFELTQAQQDVFDAAMRMKQPGDVVVLKGYAGTGKTVTSSHIIKARIRNGDRVLVLAPTATALAQLKRRLRDDSRSDKDDYARLDFRTMSSLTETPVPFVFLGKKSEQDITVNKKERTIFDEYLHAYRLEDLGGHADRNIKDIHTLRTFLKRLLRREFKEDVESVIYQLITSKKRKVRSNGGYEIEEVFSFNTELAKRIDSLKQLNVVENTEHVFKSAERIRESLRGYNFLLIDESPMVSERHSELIETVIREADDRNKATYPSILYAGDDAQLKPVRGHITPHMLKDVNEHNHVFELTEILRSTDRVAKIAQSVRVTKQYQRLFGTLPGFMRVDKSFKKQNDFTGRLTLDVQAILDAHLDIFENADVILTSTNDAVNALNTAIRKKRGFTGNTVNVGETLMVTLNAGYSQAGIGFANGEEFKVQRVMTDADEMIQFIEGSPLFATLRDEELSDEYELLKAYVDVDAFVLVELINSDGVVSHAFIDRVLSQSGNDNASHILKTQRRGVNDISNLNHGKVPHLQVSYGYARTIHKAQGAEWQNVAVIIDEGLLGYYDYLEPGSGKAAFYTVVSRAKETLNVISVP